MKKLIFISALLATTLLSAQESLSKQLPVATKQFYPTMSYQGIIKDNNGKALADGNYKIAFSMYESETAEKPLWSEEQTLVLSSGVLSAQVGAVNLLNLPFDKQYFISVTVNGEELPRTMLSAAPYSFMAKTLDKDAIVGKNGVTVEKNKEGKIEIGGNGSVGDGKTTEGWTLSSGTGTVSTDNYVKLSIGKSLIGYGYSPSESFSCTIPTTNLPINIPNYSLGWYQQGASGLHAVFSSYAGISLFTDSQNRLSIAKNGQVIIGGKTATNHPDALMHVNGKIATKQLVVTQSPWADYVFAPDYKLRSLEEVENHIKAKGHLPGVVSATEVAENGVDIGTNQAKLLEKVEELTLYIIEQNKRIKELETKVGK